MTWLGLAATVWPALSLAAGLLIGKAAALDEQFAGPAPGEPEPTSDRLFPLPVG